MVSWLRDKYMIICPELDERGRRRWAAMEAHSLGWGGVTAVALATGLSDRTIRNGIREICGLDELGDRQRRPGAGRKRRESEQPGIPKALDTLGELDTKLRGLGSSLERQKGDFREWRFRIRRISSFW